MSTDAERQRVRRQRLRDREIVVPVPVGEDDIDTLVAARLLDPALAGDRLAIGGAIRHFLKIIRHA